MFIYFQYRISKYIETIPEKRNQIKTLLNNKLLCLYLFLFLTTVYSQMIPIECLSLIEYFYFNLPKLSNISIDREDTRNSINH